MSSIPSYGELIELARSSELCKALFIRAKTHGNLSAVMSKCKVEDYNEKKSRSHIVTPQHRLGSDMDGSAIKSTREQFFILGSVVGFPKVTVEQRT